MKTIIYHSADYDGIFCHEIAKNFLGPGNIGDPNLYIGWNFGEPHIPVPDLGEIYILDLSPECLVNGGEGVVPSRIIWIDHHKTSIAKYPELIPGYRIDGVAACRLAWQWFFTWNNKRNPTAEHFASLPTKQDFVERKVTEPISVRLAGEYDIWDKRDPNVDTFQYGLRAQKEIPFALLLESSVRGIEMTNQVISDGQAAQRYAQKIDEDLVKYRSYRMDWEGLNFIVLNTGRFNSLTFAALDKPETGHDALLGYMFNGKVWTVSLYHANHRRDIDLSTIAVKYGGGGHKGACGFTCSKLPFAT